MATKAKRKKMEKRMKRVRRAPVPEPRTEVLPPVRVTPAEWNRWMDKADEGGETLSAFMRRAMDEANPLIHEMHADG